MKLIDETLTLKACDCFRFLFLLVCWNLPLPLKLSVRIWKKNFFEGLHQMRPTSSSHHAHHKSHTSSSYKVWWVLYGIIGIWVTFLFYFHYLSVKPVSPSSNVEGETSSTVPQITVDSTPSIAQSQESGKNDEDLMHIVFSTDCSFFQDWQTLAVFHSATVVGQKGKITRIASGCAEDKQKELEQLYSVLFPQYSAHFTPDFKLDEKTKKKYDFYNKPYGLHHWLQHADPPIPDGTVVILIDPDMILLRPFTLDFAGNPLNIFMDGFNTGKTEEEILPKRIGKGHPVAQLYGLHAPWTKDDHKHFNRRQICGEGSPCLNVTNHFGEYHFR
jgi:hypothetical protein